MASESSLRMQDWLMHGCNNFDGNKIAFRPLSIWTDKDIWEYIHRFNVPYSPIYDNLNIKRTGRMFCRFGGHRDNVRFIFLKEKYPKAYNNFMKLENNGITYKEALVFCKIISLECTKSKAVQMSLNFLIQNTTIQCKSQNYKQKSLG